MEIQYTRLNINNKSILEMFQADMNIQKYIHVSDNFYEYLISSENIIYMFIVFEGIYVGAVHIEVKDRTANFSIEVLTKYQRRGIASKVIEDLKRDYFRLGIDTYNVSIAFDNKPSLQLFKNSGFDYTGVEDKLHIYQYKINNNSKRLFHGSISEGISKLVPISIYNDDKVKNVVYLTENKPYALFYIWDGVRNKRKKKWITCWIDNGIVHYEEQFSNQLQKFYDGVSGYLYSFNANDLFVEAKEEDMWVSFSEVKVDATEYVQNVYNRIMEYERKGNVVIHRFNEITLFDKEIVIDKISKYIVSKGLVNTNSELSRFIASNHVDAWNRAQNMMK